MNIPVSLYIHLPWCKTKCPYCDFNSHKAEGCIDSDGYLQAMLREWQQRKDYIQNRHIVSIYCGGGTPNLLPPEFYEKLLTHISASVTFDNNCEITLEANPGERRIHDYAGYKKAGFNRLSLGIQSLELSTLQSLGRDYTPNMAKEAIALAMESGINNINFDSIFATPDQTVAGMESQLKALLAYKPTHFSHYELTIEQNTYFYNNTPKNLPDDDAKAEMYDLAKHILSKHGYNRYEVSAYAKPEQQCQHNINYWMFGDYIGLGAGAHGKISFPGQKQLVRYANIKQPGGYIKSLIFSEPEVQQPQQEILMQFFLNTFRLCGGIELSKAAARLFVTPKELLQSIQPWIEKKHICQSSLNKGEICLTPQAFLHQNQLISDLI